MNPYILMIMLSMAMLNCSAELLSLRLRSLSGRLLRASFQSNSTFSDLHNFIESPINNLNEKSDIIEVGNTTLAIPSLAGNKTFLRHILNDGDILVLSKQIVVQEPAKFRRKSMRSNLKLRRGSVATIKRKREELLKINKYRPHMNYTVVIRASTMGSVFDKLSKSHNRVSLLLGSVHQYAVRVRDNTSNEYLLCDGAIDIDIDDIDKDLEAWRRGSGKEWRATESSELGEQTECIVSESVRLASRLGLRVIGLAVRGSVDKTWTVQQVHLALHLRKICKSSNDTEPFIVLSVNGLNEEVSVEAHQLSAESIFLHEKGAIVRERVGENALIRLTEPVLVGGVQEVTSVDPMLFAVPIAVRSAANSSSGCIGCSSAEGEDEGVFEIQAFPSLHDLNSDAETAKRARIYVSKLLRAFLTAHSQGGEIISGGSGGSGGGKRDKRELEKRLRDPHLLLFLSLLVGDGDGAEVRNPSSHSHSHGHSGEYNASNTCGGGGGPLAPLCTYLLHRRSRRSNMNTINTMNTMNTMNTVDNEDEEGDAFMRSEVLSAEFVALIHTVLQELE